MSHNCEYRCADDRSGGKQRTFNLFIDEKPTNMRIFGILHKGMMMPGRGMPRIESLWFAEGGLPEPEKNNIKGRYYPSLEAAFQGEKLLVESISRAGQIDKIMSPPDDSGDKKDKEK
jgi:hypothetical protein